MHNIKKEWKHLILIWLCKPLVNLYLQVTEQRNFWGADAADTDGSRNVVGIKNYAVDGLIESLINASDREELITITKALDRVLLWNYYVIPQWHISSYRVLYWDFFDQPKIKPKYSLGFDTWWINQNKFETIQSNRTSN